MTDWVVRLSFAARADFDGILNWTKTNFGDLQADKYARILEDAIARLTDGPEAFGAKARDDLSKGLRSLHVRNGRHVLLFRTEEKGNSIVLLRILHDSMDFARHLPEQK